MKKDDPYYLTNVDHGDYGGTGREYCYVELEIDGKLVNFECDDEETARFIVSKIRGADK